MTAKETFILNAMRKLTCSREEAIELWDFDHEKIESAEVAAIEQKKKEASPINKVKNLKAKKKVDTNKESIIRKVESLLRSDEFFQNPEEIKTGKFVFQDLDGSFYTLALTKNKTKPDGYKGGE